MVAGWGWWGLSWSVSRWWQDCDCFFLLSSTWRKVWEQYWRVLTEPCRINYISDPYLSLCHQMGLAGIPVHCSETKHFLITFLCGCWGRRVTIQTGGISPRYSRTLQTVANYFSLPTLSPHSTVQISFQLRIENIMSCLPSSLPAFRSACNM